MPERRGWQGAGSADAGQPTSWKDELEVAQFRVGGEIEEGVFLLGTISGVGKEGVVLRPKGDGEIAAAPVGLLVLGETPFS